MKWTKTELEFLKENYPYLNDFSLSKQLNRPIPSIRTKANRYLGLMKNRKCLTCAKDINPPTKAQRCIPCSEISKKMNKSKRYLDYARSHGVKPKNLWTGEELKHLEENYPSTDDEELARNLNRSIHAIRTKANKVLRLKKLKQCLECKTSLISCSPTRLRCNKCAVNYNSSYKRKWAEIKKGVIKKRLAKWILNNSARKKEIDRLWRIKNRARKLETDRRNYQRLRELENERRQLLNLPRIGKGYSKEQELLKYVRGLFSGETVLYRDREILEGYELDILLPNLKIAFEYQGIQHFEFVKFFHRNQDGLRRQFMRDIETKKRCKEKGITLIEVFYYESLSEQLILTKLIEAGIGMCTTQLNLKSVIKNHSLGGIKNEQTN